MVHGERSEHAVDAEHHQAYHKGRVEQPGEHRHCGAEKVVEVELAKEEQHQAAHRAAPAVVPPVGGLDVPTPRVRQDAKRGCHRRGEAQGPHEEHEHHVIACLGQQRGGREQVGTKVRRVDGEGVEESQAAGDRAEADEQVRGGRVERVAADGACQRARDRRREDGMEGEGEGDASPVDAVEGGHIEVHRPEGVEDAPVVAEEAGQRAAARLMIELLQHRQHAAGAREEPINARGRHQARREEEARKRAIALRKAALAHALAHSDHASHVHLDELRAIWRPLEATRGRARREGDVDEEHAPKGEENVAEECEPPEGEPLVLHELHELRAGADE